MLDETSAADSGAAGSSTGASDTAAAAAASSNNVSSGVAFVAAEDYSTLASLPTPNKNKFNANGVPGETQIRKLASLPTVYRQYMLNEMGLRTIRYTRHGNILRMLSRQEIEEKRQDETMANEGLSAGCYAPKITVEDSRTVSFKDKKKFMCNGTMLRHTIMSWADAPAKFQKPHRVDEESPVQSVCYQDKIEELMPFDCTVYWKTVWEKCMSCHKADKEFERWAIRTSTPGGKEACKKRKPGAIEDEANGQGEAKSQKINLEEE